MKLLISELPVGSLTLKKTSGYAADGYAKK